MRRAHGLGGILLRETSVLIDKQRLLNEFSGDEEILVDLRRVFLAELPKMMAALEKSIRDGDAKDLEYRAHTLKGAVSNFQTEAVKEAAFLLENQGREGAIKGAQENFDKLKQLIIEFTKELDAIIDRIA
jgi:HPt (histidine-containing phosphotransfer) domain-containing protein